MSLADGAEPNANGSEPSPDGSEWSPDGASAMDLRPVSDVLFQSDTVLVGDRGPVLCSMGEPLRQAEIPIVRGA